MMLGWKIFCGAILLIAFSIFTFAAETQESLLTYGITGSDSSGLYSFAMRNLNVQKLLLDIIAKPRDSDYVNASLRDTKVTAADLQSLGLIRQDRSEYVINFYLMTKADEIKVRKVTEAHARNLAASLLAHRKEFEDVLGKYDLKSVDQKELAYILLGCFSLDWDGLNITAEHGYRVEAQPRANGDQYTPWAREKSDLSMKGLFWGSHNDYEAEVVLTSFGDHFSVPRFALPDLFSTAPGRVVYPEMEISFRRHLASVVDNALKNVNEKIGRIMLSLRDGPKNSSQLATLAKVDGHEIQSLLELLMDLQYIENQSDVYSAKIPLLTERDQQMVSAILAMSRSIITEWLDAEYSEIEKNLLDISASRYKVPYKTGFTQIWHYIFGAVNQLMIESGMFADPYSSNRKYKGFIPVVWHPSLNPDLTQK